MSTEIRLARTFMHHHAEESALALERMPLADVIVLLSALPPETSAGVISRMTPYFGVECLRTVPVEFAGELLGTIPREIAAILLRRLPRSERGRLIDAAPAKVSSVLRVLLRFPENTAGALMDPEVMAMPGDIKVGEVFERVKNSGIRVSYYVYIVDREGRLTGVMNLREIIAAKPDTPVGQIMHRGVATLHVRSDMLAIQAHPGWRWYQALPVVDDAGLLVGVLRYKTIRPAEEEVRDTNPFAAGLALGELYWSTIGELLQVFWSASPSKTGLESEDADGK
jgi:Mg/Co/Ni transporter MgtE